MASKFTFRFFDFANGNRPVDFFIPLHRIRTFLLGLMLATMAYDEAFAQKINLEVDVNTSGSTNPRNFIKTAGGFVFLAPDKYQIWEYKNGIYRSIFTSDYYIRSFSLVDSVLCYQRDGYQEYGINLFDLKTYQNHYYRIAYPEKFFAREGYFFFISNGTEPYLYKVNLQTFELSKVDTNYLSAVEFLNGESSFEYFKNGVIYCSVPPGSSSNNQELYKIEGLSGHRQLIKDINPGSASSKPQKFTVVNDKLYFIADDGTHGYELWVTNGETDGTFLFKDFTEGEANTGFVYFEYNKEENMLYFIITTGGVYQLWKTDGTLAGTTMIVECREGFNRFTRHKNLIFLHTYASYCPWWRYDTQTDSLRRETAVYRRSDQKIHIIGDVILVPAENIYGAFNNYFLAYNTVSSSYELLRRDRFKNEFDDTGSMFLDEGFLYFSAKNNATGRRELYRSDGTERGTKKLILNQEAGSNPLYLFKYQNNIYFSGYFNSQVGQEVCKLTEVCRNEEKVMGISNGSFTVEADKSIIATNQIESNARVKYDVGGGIELRPGFSVEKGGVFRTNIDGCYSNNWRSTEPGWGTAVASYNNVSGELTMDGYGKFEGKEDHIYYINKSMTGDVVVEAKVKQMTNMNTMMSGIMLRSNTSLNGAFYTLYLDGGGFVKKMRRTNTDVYHAVVGSVPTATADVWLRMQKTGNVVKCFYKVGDAGEWTELVGTDNGTIVLDEDFRVGFYISSGNVIDYCYTIFSNLTVNGQWIN